VVEGTTIKLYFGPDLIGSVSDTSYSDFNWYGLLHPADGMPRRIKEFIAMCKDWHSRLKAGQPHDPDEFNPWEDVHGSGDWRATGGRLPPTVRCKGFAPLCSGRTVGSAGEWQKTPNETLHVTGHAIDILARDAVTPV
jgi:hypothetical protein